MQFEPVVEIVRLEEAKTGTFGALRVNKRVLCLTLEPPDRLNERDRSSIPAQQYRCVRTASSRFGETFAIEDVPGRQAVLFHTGNSVGDTKGCIILGQRFGTLDQGRAVLDSRSAFKEFMALMAGLDAFHLTVHEHY